MNKELSLEAQDRAQRAKSYAEKFPSFVNPSDSVFTSIVWQESYIAKFPRKPQDK